MIIRQDQFAVSAEIDSPFFLMTTNYCSLHRPAVSPGECPTCEGGRKHAVYMEETYTQSEEEIRSDIYSIIPKKDIATHYLGNGLFNPKENMFYVIRKYNDDVVPDWFCDKYIE